MHEIRFLGLPLEPLKNGANTDKSEVRRDRPTFRRSSSFFAGLRRIGGQIGGQIHDLSTK
jgi:hypothetical protein